MIEVDRTYAVEKNKLFAADREVSSKVPETTGLAEKLVGAEPRERAHPSHGGVVGSIPTPPTIKSLELSRFLSGSLVSFGNSGQNEA
jgi:hypothetical protein